MIKRILVVEDDEGIRELLKELLTEKDYSVQTVANGAEALNTVKKAKPDLVILDLGLPDMKGESVCIEMRKIYKDLPIIILTGRDATEDKVMGLNLGADDYITKPFEAEELLARVKARLRGEEESTLQVADLELDNKTFQVRRGTKKIQLTPQEFKLLYYLLSNKGRVLTREMILNRVWLYSNDVDTRVVDVYVGYLRKKIDSDAKKKLIHSVRGFGYTIKE